MKFAYSTAPVLRATLLALGAFLALASADQSNPPPAYPYGAYPPPQQPQPYDPAASQGGTAAPAPTGGAPGQDYCFTLSTAQTTSSLCTVGFGGCERQRQGAIADGQTTSDCVPWSPVACFQLGADPSPTARFCAANLEDCEGWRRIDQQKNGATGDACSWKQ